MGSLPDVYTLDKYHQAQTVLLIGCGGTGGYVVPHLARFISVLKNKTSVALILADNDVVEEKNLKRQHFILRDIGKNKAEVLAERYSAALGVEIAALKKDVENIKDFDVLYRYGIRSSSFLVISCVDNNATRKIIWEWFKVHTHESKFWIDSGNEETAGQVVCGHHPGSNVYYDPIKPMKTQKKRVGEFSIPCAIELYPDLLAESRFNSELSCAERAISAPQNMQTNVTAATLIMNFAQKIISGLPLKSFAVEYNINNAFETKHLTLENLLLVNPERKPYWEQ